MKITNSSRMASKGFSENICCTFEFETDEMQDIN